MVEAPAYFVAFEHVLGVLRDETSLHNNPLARIIINPLVCD